MNSKLTKYTMIISLIRTITVPAFAGEVSTTFIPKKIAAGDLHTCLLSTSGQVKCWGYNGHGALGSESQKSRGRDPDTMGVNLPTVDLGKDVIVKDLCAGEHFSCALTTTGRVKCWGENTSGQLGQEVAEPNVGSKPNQMGDHLPWTNLGTDFIPAELQCGESFACAVNTIGQVKCWGSNTYGQLGRKTEGRYSIGGKIGDMGDKLPYLPLPPVKSIAPGREHTCAATSSAVYCWGANSSGQIGVESADQLVELPANVKDARKVKLEDEGVLTNVHAVSSGKNYSCAEYSTGLPIKKKIKCWGYNAAGQLGIGTTQLMIGKTAGTMGSKLSELKLDSRDFIQLETHGSFSCALKQNGMVQCWGSNYEGSLGLGDTDNRGTKPQDLGPNLKPVDLALPALALSHGSLPSSICALLVNHEIKCWGGAAFGQLGYEDDVSRGGNTDDMGENLPFVRYK